MPADMVARNVGRFDLLLPKGATVRGAFVVGGVRITEHVDEDVPDRQQKLWDAVLENERKRVQGTGDGRGVTLRTFGLAPRVLALLAGLEIPEGMARYQLTALANKGGHFVTLSTVVQEGKEEAAMAAVRTVVDAYRHLDAAAITGLHQKGWFYTRNGAVVTEPSREVAAESFEVTAHHGAMTFDIESTTVAEPEEARGVFDVVTELLSTWALPFKGHRRDSREVAGLKGVETIIEDRGKLTGLWLHQPARSERPRPSVRLSVETDGTDLPAFLAVWEPVLCSVRRHD